MSRMGNHVPWPGGALRATTVGFCDFAHHVPSYFKVFAQGFPSAWKVFCTILFFFFLNFKNFYFTSFQPTGRRLDICIVCETTPPGLFLASDSPPGRPVTEDHVPRAVRPGPATVRQRLPRAALTLPPVLRPRDPPLRPSPAVLCIGESVFD